MIDYEGICQAHDLVAMVEQATTLHRVGAEWRGACPIHGGQDTTAFAVYNDRGKWRWKCFSNDCGQGDVVDFIMAFHRVDKARALEMLGADHQDAEKVRENTARALDQRAAALEKSIKDAQEILQQMRAAQAWVSYQHHLQSSEQARRLWQERGLEDYWQDYFRLGYCPAFPVHTEAGKLTTPTLTIPVWGPGWELQNIRHRLLNPIKPGDKYRPEKSGLPASPYMTDPDIGWDTEHYLVVEGEIKSMVTFATLDTPGVQVIGIPGKSAFRSLVDKLKGRDVVISLDPGAEEDARNFAQAVGGRMFTTQHKIDDAILAGLIDKQMLYRMYRTARKVK